MEYRQLQYFVMLGKNESFTRTAGQLHVSQPSVTKGIKALETELGVTLIDRRIKKVTLTPEGKLFYQHALKIMQTMEEAAQAMKRFSGQETEKIINFGVPPLIESYLFPDFFSSFQAAKPSLALNIEEFNDSMEIRRRIESGKLDFGIVLGDVAEKRDGELIIMRGKMKLCLYHGHPLEYAPHVEMLQLKNAKFIMQKENTYQYRSVIRCCEQNGFQPIIAHTFSPPKAIKEFVIKREGITILPGFVVRKDTLFAKKELRPAMNFQVSLIRPPGKYLSETDSALLEFMKQYISTAEFKASFLNE